MQSQALQALDDKAKPPGSLGALESLAAKLCQLQGSLLPSVDGACLLVFVADHGITAAQPSVSAYPREVTQALFPAIAAGQAAGAVLCAANDCELELVDVGVDADISSVSSSNAHVHVHHQKVARATANFLDGPAMDRQQCAAAMQAGRDAVERVCSRFRKAAAAGTTAGTAATAAAAEAAVAIAEPPAEAACSADLEVPADGVESTSAASTIVSKPQQPLIEQQGPGSDSRVVLCLGEAGIGNTTSAAALVAALIGISPEEACGRGTGVNNAGLASKHQAVTAGLHANAALIAEGPLGALQAVGGFELAAMVGACLEAAKRSMPVIIDGFISSTAALVAVKHAPEVAACLFPSHASAEKAAGIVSEALGIGDPPLHMGLRLGEGTGAVLALPLLRSACSIMRMASLAEVLAGQQE